MCDGGTNLASKVEELWNKNTVKIEKDLDRWLSACKEGKEKIRIAKKQFHQWRPLRVYVAVGKVKSTSDSVFSVRFFGQEVAELVVKTKDEVQLSISDKHHTSNSKWFGASFLKRGKYSWNGGEAKMFRKFFKDFAANSGGKPKVRSEEHRIESKFIDEMLKGRGKFGRPDLKIQPVKLGGCPLQFPVPFSANTGKPAIKTGHIDILARRKAKDNKTRLSVWELKKPGVYKQAASQAYIYAVQLLQILRSYKGNEWYKLFGFSGSIPKSLEIEAVVAITDDPKKQFDSEKEKFGKNEINGDVVKLYAVYYEEESGAIRLGKESFREG
jgi:hypothetical protein